MELSVCIVSWNTSDLLATCLGSLFAELDRWGVAAEVFVIDNASTDGSPEMVARSYPRTQLVRNAENVGFAVANNQAIRRSSGGLVLLLNSDTRVTSGSLEALAAHMDAHARCGAAGPKVLGLDGTLQLTAARFPRLRHAVFGGVLSNELFRRVFPHARFFAELGLTAEEHLEERSVDWLMGCCLLIRREALEEVGLLDERIFFFYEEADLCMRLKRAGWSVELFPGAEIVHVGGGSYRGIWSLAEEVGRQLTGLEYFHLKHYGRLDLAALRVANVAGSGLKVAAFGLAALAPSRRVRSLAREKARWHAAVLGWYARRALSPRSATRPGRRSGGRADAC